MTNFTNDAAKHKVSKEDANGGQQKSAFTMLSSVFVLGLNGSMVFF